MPVKGGPNIRTNQAIIWLDSADKSSYPGAGTTWVNSVTPGTNNGTLTNTSFNPTDALGALFFSGSNTFADMGNIGAISSSYTFQVAVKPVSAPSPYTILSYTSGSGTGSVTFRLDYSSSIQTAVFSAFASSGSVNKTYNLSTTIPTGSWSILHGVFSGTTLAFYKNGSFINSTLITGSNVGYSANNRFLVGGISQFTGSYLSGSVANVAVYNTSLGSYSIATNYNGLATRFGLSNIVTPIIEEDAQAFIEAAGITNPIEVSAITNLVIDLKTYNIWDKMKAMYPMVGGTATSQKYNLKNPNTFTGTFVGGWIHSFTGAKPNGVNAYMATGCFASQFTANSQHFSNYSRQLTDTGNVELGLVSYDSGKFNYVMIQVPGLGIYAAIQSGDILMDGAYADPSYGLTISNRRNSGFVQRYNRNNKLESISTSNGLGTLEVFMSAIQTPSPQFYGTCEIAFGSMGDGLTDTEASNFYTAVQAFQTTLGRQV
jgi:hypothetical protein